LALACFSSLNANALTETTLKEAAEEPANALPADENKQAHLRLPHQNVEVQFNPFSELNSKDRHRPVMISLPSSTLESVLSAINKIPNVEIKNQDRWKDAIQDGAANIETDGVFHTTANDPDAEFVQAVETESGRMAPGFPTYKSVSNESLSGERAVLRFMDHVNLGGVLRLPCWNTGMSYPNTSASPDAISSSP
jgi:hypothetical protein